jgi:hypothetical protein
MKVEEGRKGRKEIMKEAFFFSPPPFLWAAMGRKGGKEGRKGKHGKRNGNEEKRRGNES